MIKKISVVLALTTMVVVNVLAVTLPINGKSTKELSDAIPTFFTPSGYVFSIWSFIYLALIGYGLFQLFSSAQRKPRLHSIAWWFVLNALANAGWILLWHYQYVATSVILMGVILVTLIVIYEKLNIGRTKVDNPTFWFSHFPFSLYLGWISVATIANVAAALQVHQWGGWGIAQQTWSAIMIVFATLLTMFMVVQRNDYIFASVMIWSLIGIGLKFSQVHIIVWTIVVCIIVIALMPLVTHIRKMTSQQ